MSRQVGAKRQRYDVKLLDEAADLVRSKSITMSRAAKEYGIPKTTLHDRVHMKYAGSKTGPKTVLTTEEESRIAEWAVHMSRIGYGRTRKELLNMVKKIIDEDGRKTPFKDNRPGKDWLKGFLTRHPQLSIRTTLQLGKERAIISPSKIRKWFEDLTLYIDQEVKDHDILRDPSRIYNADESGFSLCTTGTQVIGYKGAPVVYHYGNSNKSQLTIMAACSAAGHFIPPMIIFPGKRFSYDPLEGFEEAAMGRSDSGWMDAGVFSEWLTNVFIPAIEARHVKKPVILFIDGHTTHITPEASDACIEGDIELYCLLEHASHVMQPLDLRLFSSLKKTWKQAVRDWQSDNIGEYVTKRTFARVFKMAWERSATVDVAVKGFLEAGLFPLNPERVINSVKLEPSKVFSDIHGTSTSSTSVGSLPFTATKPPATVTANVITPKATFDTSHVLPATTVEICSMTTPYITTDPVTPSATSGISHTTAPGPVPVMASVMSVTPTAATVLPSSSTVLLPVTPPETASSGATTAHASNTTTVLAPASAPSSPFSKFLVYPAVSSNKGKAKRASMPKAITGSVYRKLLVEKKEKKEKELQEKLRKKKEREKKRKEREEEKERKQLVKQQKKNADKEKKRLFREKMMKSIMQSDSDDAEEIAPGQCYACDTAYESFIQCTICERRFHIACVEDQFVDELPFECKYC